MATILLWFGITWSHCTQWRRVHNKNTTLLFVTIADPGKHYAIDVLSYDTLFRSSYCIRSFYSPKNRKYKLNENCKKEYEIKLTQRSKTENDQQSIDCINRISIAITSLCCESVSQCIRHSLEQSRHYAYRHVRCFEGAKGRGKGRRRGGRGWVRGRKEGSQVRRITGFFVSKE